MANWCVRQKILSFMKTAQEEHVTRGPDKNMQRNRKIRSFSWNFLPWRESMRPSFIPFNARFWLIFFVFVFVCVFAVVDDDFVFEIARERSWVSASELSSSPLKFTEAWDFHLNHSPFISCRFGMNVRDTFRLVGSWKWRKEKTFHSIFPASRLRLLIKLRAKYKWTLAKHFFHRRAAQKNLRTLSQQHLAIVSLETEKNHISRLHLQNWDGNFNFFFLS